MKVISLLKVTEVAISMPPVQQVAHLSVSVPNKIIVTPVSPINHQFSVQRNKVASHHMKVLFLNESQLQHKKLKMSLHSKGHFMGTGWKMKRESNSHHRWIWY